MSDSAIIEVKTVSKAFGGLRAVRECSLAVPRGSITGLIGPNGAGKTTLFNIVAGRLPPDTGQIIFEGEDITSHHPHLLFQKGLLRTFQIAHEFSHMTALENLMVVAPDQPGETLVNTVLRPAAVRRAEAEVGAKAGDVLKFLNLWPVRNELAGNLSGGQKKLLELGRTMMADAKAVLLDEVAAGVNRSLFNSLAENIQRMNRELGYTFFVIEHDMDLINRLCHSVIVMAEGSVIGEGALAELRTRPDIIDAYFGTENEA